jgi:surface polysaccharide O-acyltransferase-like enzyme
MRCECTRPPWPKQYVLSACGLFFAVGLVVLHFFPDSVEIFNAAISLLFFAVAIAFEIESAMGKRTTKSLYLAAAGHSDHLLPSEKKALTTSILEKQLQSSPPGRIYYLDNIKTLLVVGVTFIHSKSWFTRNPRSISNYINPVLKVMDPIAVVDFEWVMPFFFFISGYFTPGSLKRKGPRRFIKDRFRRLGIPLGVITILEPIVRTPLASLIRGKDILNFVPSVGVAWFLAALLVFSIAYAAIADEETTSGPLLPCPGWRELLFWLGVMSITQIFVLVVCEVPIYWLSAALPYITNFPGFVGYFVAGCLAQKHGWLKQIPGKLGDPRITLGILLTSTVALVVGVYVMYGNIADMTTSDGSNDLKSDKTRKPLNYWPFAVGLIAVPPVFGILTLLYSVSQLQLGPQYLNFTNSVWKALNGAAYTVYLIHYWVIDVFVYIYVKLLSLDDWYPLYNDDQPNSSKPLPSDWLILAGIAFVFVCTNVVTWPLSMFIKSLPGFKDIL